MKLLNIFKKKEKATKKIKEVNKKQLSQVIGGADTLISLALAKNNYNSSKSN